MCSLPVSIRQTLMLHPKPICFVGYDCIFFREIHKFTPTIEQIKINLIVQIKVDCIK